MKLLEYCYTGDYMEPKIKVRAPSGEVLKEGTDYLMTFENNREPGVGKAHVTGIGKYKDFVGDMEFRIIGIQDVSHQGRGIRITDTEGYVLKENGDYRVEQGKIFYMGFYEPINHILDSSKDKAVRRITSVHVLTSSCIYNGEPLEPMVIVRDQDGHAVPSGSYQVQYKNNTEAGTAEAVVRGIGDCEGIVSSEFQIRPARLSSVDITELDGEEWLLSYQGMILKEGTDYTKMEEQMKKKVRFTGIGNYTGSLTRYLEEPPAVNI